MQNTQEWVRTSLRTPGILIFGMVFAPCGWILNLTSTVSPNWRNIYGVPGKSSDYYLQQGIWDICAASTSSRDITCNQADIPYFNSQIVKVSQGLTVASLIVTIIGMAVAIPGVRCWRDRPRWTLAGLGGLLIFLSGILMIIPIAWYTHILSSIEANGNDVRVGYSIILGFIGAIFEILGGFVMLIGICRCCGGKNRGEKRVDEVTQYQHSGPPPRRVEVPSISRSRSSASSVPYSRDSMDDADFPRAKTRSQPPRSANASYISKPYDADL
ncbi:claudin-23-like [Aplochiton taeniatus]